MRKLVLIAVLFLAVVGRCYSQNVNGEATYVSFSISGAQGTYPMAINDSMTVTGYYVASSTQSYGFLRESDGSVTTFSAPGAIWTVPESINAAGDITGFYEATAGTPEGFLRYVDGRMVTFEPPDLGGYHLAPQAIPVSINEFDVIAGSFPFPLIEPSIFIRSS